MRFQSRNSRKRGDERICGGPRSHGKDNNLSRERIAIDNDSGDTRIVVEGDFVNFTNEQLGTIFLNSMGYDCLSEELRMNLGGGVGASQGCRALH